MPESTEPPHITAPERVNPPLPPILRIVAVLNTIEKYLLMVWFPMYVLGLSLALLFLVSVILLMLGLMAWVFIRLLIGA
ncbi:MAG: hypothetical protein IGS03_09530 [Candidatus Sericytochromatia bacterium]|nr:hypothetical protein [Candidatus Sericytochromatia bacterium]